MAMKTDMKAPVRKRLSTQETGMKAVKSEPAKPQEIVAKPAPAKAPPAKAAPFAITPQPVQSAERPPARDAPKPDKQTLSNIDDLIWRSKKK